MPHIDVKKIDLQQFLPGVSDQKELTVYLTKTVATVWKDHDKDLKFPTPLNFHDDFMLEMSQKSEKVFYVTMLEK